MTATNLNYTMPGRTNSAVNSSDEATNRSAFLTDYLKEVFKTFNKKTVMKDLIKKKTIAKGVKAGRFYFTGTKEAKTLIRGNQGDGSALLTNYKDIETDNIMYSDSFVYDTDVLQNPYDIINESAVADGVALAEEFDYQISIMINKAASENHRVNNPDGSTRAGGSIVTLAAAGDESDPETLAAGFQTISEEMDEKNIPESGRIAVMKSSTYNTLLNNDKLVNMDYSTGNGHYASAKLKEVFGFRVIKSQNFADTEVTKYTAGTLEEKYNHDCSNTIALCFTSEAAACVISRSLKVERDRVIRAQGEYIITTMLKGIDSLRPECSAVLKKTV